MDWLLFIKVTDLGKFKFVIIFEKLEDKEIAEKEYEELLFNYFVYFKLWFMDERADMRKVWLECYGILLQVWSIENIRKIGERWGDVVCFDYETEKKLVMEVVRILIDTRCMLYIEDYLYVIVGDMGFDIFIKEVLIFLMMFGSMKND